MSDPIHGDSGGHFTGGHLGCAEEYEVFVTGPDYQTRVASGRLGWSSIEWTRVLDDISTATVVLPDAYGGVRCCTDLGGMVPWKFGIAIERDGEQVWSGPVTRVHRARGDLPGIQLSCADTLVRLVKRLAAREAVFSFKNADAGEVLQVLVNEAARLTSDPFMLMAPEVITGVKMDRKLEPLDFEYAYDVLRDLMTSAIDLFMLDGVMHVWSPGVGWVFPTQDETGRDITAILAGHYDVNHEMHHGLFTESSFTTLPEWDIDGMQQANSVWNPGADTGEAGARRWWNAEHALGQQEVGVLDFVIPNALHRGSADDPMADDSVFQRHVDSTLSMRAIPPAVIEGGALSEHAPVRADQFHPGSLWDIDLYDACFGQLLTRARLKSVTFRVNATAQGITEEVLPTLIPPGFEEA